MSKACFVIDFLCVRPSRCEGLSLEEERWADEERGRRVVVDGRTVAPKDILSGDVPPLIPRICDYVSSHGEGEFTLQMGLRLLIR